MKNKNSVHMTQMFWLPVNIKQNVFAWFSRQQLSACQWKLKMKQENLHQFKKINWNM